MPQISLSTFLDFVAKAGTQKATVVRGEKRQPDYRPAVDFYQEIREALVRLHDPGLPPGSLHETIGRASLLDSRKQAHYQAIAEGYLEWWKERHWKWFVPPCCQWIHAGLAVRVNPELGLLIDGVPHVIKLYLKAERIPRSRVDLITHLMDEACGGLPPTPPGAAMAVLDVRRSRLVTQQAAAPALAAMLRAEATYWMALWPEL